MIPWWSTEFAGLEKANVCAAIDARCISQGRLTREFEEKLAERLGVPYVVCTTSGTTALTMALMACGVGAGDEVIVPDKTWIATAHAVMMAGAQVRLCDTEPTRPVMARSDPHLMGGLRTKAIMPVNLNGRLNEVVHHGESSIIEDSCQAFPQPPRGDIACYSLSTAKIIATGQGGFCATRSEALYRELKALRTHDVADAMVPQILQWRRFGYNFRFTDIQAAIGIAQLTRLDVRIERLREINRLYLERLPTDRRPLRHADSEIPLYNEIVLESLETQEELRDFLAAREIEARPFYPLLHTAPYLKSPGPFPNAERFAYGLVLPSGPTQTNADILKVCQAIETYRWTG
jgi:perosamine synthetase